MVETHLLKKPVKNQKSQSKTEKLLEPEAIHRFAGSVNNFEKKKTKKEDEVGVATLGCFS